MGIPQEILDEIGADVEQAVASIAAKYGMRIRYLGNDLPDEGEGISLEVDPLPEHELSREARKSPYWHVFLAGEEGTDDEAR